MLGPCPSQGRLTPRQKDLMPSHKLSMSSLGSKADVYAVLAEGLLSARDGHLTTYQNRECSAYGAVRARFLDTAS